MPIVNPKLYMETSVVSYLAARPSRDLVMAGHQQTTREWWEQRRKSFEIYASQLVWDEASVGDPAAVRRRLRVLKPLRWLQLRRDAVLLAKALVDDGPVPPNAEADALHIAISATHGMDFLLTWNFTHINNAATEESIKAVCAAHGFHCPVICTPDELGEVLP